MTDFLSEFVSNRKFRKDPETKFVVDGNRWDKQARDRIAQSVVEFQQAAGQLGEFTDTGYEAMTDSISALLKVNPKLRDTKSVRPSYLINHTVLEELLKVEDYHKLHDYCMGDPVATGLSVAQLEPDLEVIFDKLDKAKDAASNIEEMLTEIEGLSDRIDEVLTEGQEQEVTDGDQPSVEEMQASIESLMEAIAQEQEQLQNNVLSNLTDIQNSLKSGVREANESNEALSDFESWGMVPGGVAKLNGKARLELAKKLRSPYFKKMAQVIGRMQQLAMSEQYNPTNYSVDEIHKVTLGNDIARMIPAELLYLEEDDDLFLEWTRRFTERSLMVNDMKGKERVQRGGICVLLDTSTSMHGDRSIWAKGIALALLRIAKAQKRKMDVVEFAGPTNYAHFAFDTSSDNFSYRMTYDGQTIVREGPEAVMSYAEFGLTGGTCFFTPLSKGLDILKAEYDQTGRTQSDMVMLTDGQAALTTDFLAKFKGVQEQLHFKVFGIAIGDQVKKEPLSTVCDGNVITLRRLMSVDDVQPVFNGVVKQR